MISFFLRRLGVLIPTFLGITLLVFALIHMIPGDPVEAMSGERGMDSARHAQLMTEFGLNRPLPVQYVDYVFKAAKGDLGRSIVTQESVMREFLDRFPATFELSLCAITFALTIGIPAGIIAAFKRNSVVDYGVMGVSLAGYSMPIFWWALLLILFFSVQLGWTPVSGRIAVEYDPEVVTGLMLIDSLLSGEPGAFRSAASHLILPTIALGTIPLATLARMTRSAMLEVLGEDYVRAARARGLSPLRVLTRHALRNALIPVLTVIGLQVGTLLAGAILTETIFSWPGIGKWMVEAIHRRDYPVVQGGILLSATIVIAVNLIVDMLYGVVNPRIRHQR
ncbi:ABC transporter permease subunit [Uliginosibacterium gangwonense]|uniref:ABC transporter permease subunit n=1 Tax=Uliginosibacterium gangwonense TaxID=392736 RepID=UPI0003735729|nr:ABC transporter permease subunit [Uliginosibacterium gangwonense]